MQKEIGVKLMLLEVVAEVHRGYSRTVWTLLAPQPSWPLFQMVLSTVAEEVSHERVDHATDVMAEVEAVVVPSKARTMAVAEVEVPRMV